MTQPPRNETEAWQEKRLPPMPPEMKAEYDRGPSPIPAVLAIVGGLAALALVIYAAT